MILVVSIVFFFFIFFLGMSISNIVKAQEGELKLKIEDRLKNSTKAITDIRIAKRERLSDVPFLDQILQKITFVKKLHVFISQSGRRLSVGIFSLFSFTLAAVAFSISYLTKMNIWLALASTGISLFLPYFYIAICRASRFKAFANRFPDSIGLISSSLRAGHSLQMAIETVVEDSRDIVAAEFKQVLSEVEVGQNFEEALKGMILRIDTSELRLFISAVILQRETGGNLAELLDNLEFVIRERQELRRELSSATAQARLSGMILGLLPIVVGGVIFLIDNNYVLFFAKDPIGTKLLTGCIISQIMGLLWIKKVCTIDC